jgi:hypothetical protein
MGIGTSSIPTIGSTTVLAVGNSNGGTLGIVQSGSIVYRVSASTSGVDCYNPNASPIAWYTNATERMKLDASGNLGLGVTPSAWTDYKVLQVSGAYFYGYGNDELGMGQGAYYGSGWKYAATGVAATWLSAYRGEYKFFTAPSGTAGNAISFTQAMTLDASGRWLLGTTTGVGNDFASIRFNSSGTYSQGLNMVDANASASGGVFQVFRKSDDTYLGNIRRNVTDNAIYVGGNSYLALGSGDTERARIDSSGNLLIGTDIPAGTTGSVGVRKGGTGELILLANNGGLYQQAVSSYFLVTTAGGNTSDATLKKNVQQLSGALAKVCAIRGVNFEFIAEQKSTPDNGVQVGVIAQEVEAQYPEIVVTNKDGIKSVRYEKLVAPLIEAIKELKAEFDAYKASHP